MFLHFDIYGEQDEQTWMDYFFWVARNSQRTVLIDCGFNVRSGASRGRTMLCAPVTALERLGIGTGDVSLMIATHAHYDHIGNLDAFPGTEVVISAREYDFWTGPLASRPLFAISAEDNDIAQLRRRADNGQIRFVGGRQRIADGIDVIEVGGHTPGQLIVLISTESGEVVIASDALHFYDEMRLDRPFTHVADLSAMYTGFGMLRELAAGGARKLVAGHDPEVMQRFGALSGDAAGLAVRVG